MITIGVKPKTECDRVTAVAVCLRKDALYAHGPSYLEAGRETQEMIATDPLVERLHRCQGKLDTTLLVEMQQTHLERLIGDIKLNFTEITNQNRLAFQDFVKVNIVWRAIMRQTRSFNVMLNMVNSLAATRRINLQMEVTRQTQSNLEQQVSRECQTLF